MKIKFLATILLFSFSLKINSQITSGKIVYQIDMNRFVQSAISKYGQSSKRLIMIKKTADIAKQIDMQLLFKENKSIFEHQKGLSLDNEQLTDLVKSLIAEGTYFTDFKESSQILHTKFENKDYYIANDIKEIKWELLNESKEISNFKCYKAIYRKKIAGSFKEIIAWYTPEIPLSLGPKEYAGSLPGLILELDEPIAHFKCTSISLNPKKEIKIDWPKNVKLISSEEYKKEGDKLYNNIKSRNN